MLSPFPGMDPYLEGSLWTTVHSQFTAEIARQLAPKLRPRYLALTTERFVMTCSKSVSVMTPEPIPHVTVEIRDTANRQLVTAIEVLSPTNKRGEGRREYLARRQRLLRSAAHLLEIDLLREGLRVPMREPLPRASYFIFLSRADDRPMTSVWPVPLDQPLPSVPVPLLAGDADIGLDLQAALTNVYVVVGYDLAVDYTKPPEAPLEGDWAKWAAGRIMERGDRSGNAD